MCLNKDSFDYQLSVSLLFIRTVLTGFTAHHHHVSSLDGMVEAADINLRQTVLTIWIIVHLPGMVHPVFERGLLASEQMLTAQPYYTG